MRFIDFPDYQELKTKYKLTIEKKSNYEGNNKNSKAEFIALFLLIGGYNPARKEMNNKSIPFTTNELNRFRNDFLNIVYEMEDKIKERLM